MVNPLFRSLPQAPCTRQQGRLAFTILGAVASGTPLHSVALSREGRLICRVQYRPLIRTPLEGVMHNIGQLQHAFALPISQTDAKADWTDSFEIEVTDWVGEMQRGRIECKVDRTAPDVVAISASPGEPTTELPTDPPIVVQLISLEIANATLTARGWALARGGIRTVRIAVGEHVAVAVHGQPGIEIPGYCRDYPDADRPGFAAQIDLAGQDVPAQVDVTAASRDGMECYAAIPMSPSAVPAAVTSNLTMPLASGASTRPPAVIYVEYPRVANGAAALNGRQLLQLTGWAVAPQGIEQINVYADGRYIASADYGTVRKDVAAVFPRWRDSHRSGFGLRLPARVFLKDPATIEIEAQLASGKTVNGHFVLSFGTRLANPADDSPWGLLMTDISIWQHARTAKMWAAGREEEHLRGLEENYRARNDAGGAARVQLIGKAIEILGIAWRGEPIDPTLRRYLSEHGYL
ncbi:MAG TPA: hypothetical protein VH855_09845 [Acetobacteraceae bacterium]|jgi:hypothetical protein